MASILNPAVGSADDTALIMGYTETPNPLPSYVTEVMNLFVNPVAIGSGMRVSKGKTPLKLAASTGYPSGVVVNGYLPK